MPPGSHTLDEEGACITTFKLVENGLFQEKGLIALLQAPGEKKTGCRTSSHQRFKAYSR